MLIFIRAQTRKAQLLFTNSNNAIENDGMKHETATSH